jgi:hypothetical protein
MIKISSQIDIRWGLLLHEVDGESHSTLTSPVGNAKALGRDAAQLSTGMGPSPSPVTARVTIKVIENPSLAGQDLVTATDTRDVTSCGWIGRPELVREHEILIAVASSANARSLAPESKCDGATLLDGSRICGRKCAGAQRERAGVAEADERTLATRAIVR